MEKMTAIITGASSGLGREIAIEFARKGMNCVLAARSADKLDALKNELQGQFGGDHISIPTDLYSSESIRELFTKTIAHYGKFNIVVNNAGDAYLWPLADHSEEKIEKLLSLLVRANALMHRYAIGYIKSFGEEKKVILDVLSSAAQQAYSHNAIYGSGKEFVRALSMRNELDEKDITFIRMYPSNINTPLVNESTASPEVWEAINKGFKLDPKFVAKVAAALVEEGGKADVYMQETAEGPWVENLEFSPPKRTRNPNLESLL